MPSRDRGPGYRPPRRRAAPAGRRLALLLLAIALFAGGIYVGQRWRRPAAEELRAPGGLAPTGRRSPPATSRW
jgi:hypothetical protein